MIEEGMRFDDNIGNDGWAGTELDRAGDNSLAKGEDNSLAKGWGLVWVRVRVRVRRPTFVYPATFLLLRPASPPLGCSTSSLFPPSAASYVLRPSSILLPPFTFYPSPSL